MFSKRSMVASYGTADPDLDDQGLVDEEVEPFALGEGILLASARAMPSWSSFSLQQLERKREQTGFIPTSKQETELSGRLARTLTLQQKLMLRYAFTNSWRSLSRHLTAAAG
jgi:hypothetical protein